MSEELKLDKSDWTPVTFGDVVAEVRTSTKDPVADGIERVVGLEHIEPECIHLRDWASIEEDTTFTKVFRKGHVLFGRRRAYLKKAALADFDGICSSDITVMEAKDGLIPELLPFLVNNDKFFDYAVQHSAGGLSPRTKFKDIANYEFLIPPEDQKAKLAGLLWAADQSVEATKSLLTSLVAQKEAIQRHHFEGPKEPTKPLGECAKIYTGGTPNRKKSEFWGGDIPWIKTGEIDYSLIEDTEEKITQAGLDGSSAKIVPKGSLLMAMYGQGVTRGRVCITGIDASINQACAAIEFDDATTAMHTFYFLEHKYEEIRDLAHSRTSISASLRASRFRSRQMMFVRKRYQSSKASQKRFDLLIKATSRKGNFSNPSSTKSSKPTTEHHTRS